jgi:hypothetical protein
MIMAKISAPLAATIDTAEPDEEVVVIVAMVPGEARARSADEPRQQQIAGRRAEFEKQASPIEQTISSIGGEVLDRAWINNTMKARVPASAVQKLVDLDGVETVDLEHRLQRD